ncbi:hypothetical protein CSB92_3864 [Pseudomonas aeruginosa]|nr:hypothetical protein HW04_31405 [Pseudomonas aeruginosa]QDL63419.1 hypothetical protein EIP97_07440 [Pseudomonas aeruginosa UCBPP-PA14]ASM84249.1 hypothetical protein BWR11_07420 [Pseudomonas aeruginosa]AUA69825.1 hypothetical protein CWI25_07285 [Pseudomonas aeruginosa]AUA94386.1 hypothetical protein CWI24_07470 [Pseudomonas aeruginosa]
MTSWRHSSAAMRRMACSPAPLWHALGNVCARRPGAAAARSTTHARLTTAPRVRHSWRLSRVPARQHENNP